MNKPIGERELVLAILLEVTRDQVPGHLALARVLTKYQYLDKRERAFITRVTEGTLEHMIEIDYIIDQFSNKDSKDEAGHPDDPSKRSLSTEVYGSGPAFCSLQ